MARPDFTSRGISDTISLNLAYYLTSGAYGPSIMRITAEFTKEAWGHVKRTYNGRAAS